MRSLFDTVRDHLLTQMKRSLRDGGPTCAYRGEGGLKCAAGVLISDELYDASMEGLGVYQPIFSVRYNDDELRLLAKLQFIHDAYEPEVWAEKLAELEEGIFGKV